MKNKAFIILSLFLAVAIITGAVYYKRYGDATTNLQLSEKKASEMKEVISRLNGEAASLRDQINKVLQDLENAKNMTKSFQTASSSKDIRVSELEIERVRFEAEMRQLKFDYDTLTSDLKELKRTKERITALEAAIRIKDQTLLELQEKLGEIERDVQDEKKSRDIVKAQLSAKGAKVAELQKKLGTVENRIVILQKKMDASKHEIELLNNQLTEIRAEKAMAETRADQLQKKYDALLMDTNELKKVKDRNHLLEERLKGIARDLEKKQGDLVSLRAALTSKEERISELSAEKAQNENFINDLKNEYVTLVADLKDLKKAKELIPQLERTILSKNQRLAELEAIQKDLKHDYEQERKTNESLRAELSKRGALINDLKDKLEHSQKQVLALERDVSRNAEEILEVRNQVRTLGDEKALAERKVRQLQKKHETLLADISQLENQGGRIPELETSLHKKNTIIAELEKKIKDTEFQISCLDEALAGDKDKIENLSQLQLELKEEREAVLTRLDKVKNTYDSLVSDLKRQISNQEVTIKTYQEKISVTFVNRILFDPGKASISPEGKRVLKKVGMTLRGVRDKIVRVVGHTDDMPIIREYRWKYPSNWELSAARAASVVRYFQGVSDLEPNNMEAVGRSFFDPVASNETREGRAQNRRVNIIIAPQIR